MSDRGERWKYEDAEKEATEQRGTVEGEEEEEPRVGLGF